jgi:integrase/recombinase XerD
MPLPERGLAGSRPIWAWRNIHNGLIFGNSKGNPDKHLLRIIKKVALRAQLNCGKCVGIYERQKVSCSTHPVCRRWLIQTLRKTWATFQARSGTDVRTIQADAGHSSLQTTLQYLAAEDRRSVARRAQINAADARVRQHMPAVQ